MLHGVADGEEAAVLLRLGTDEEVSFERSSHNTRVLRPSDVVREVTFGHLETGD